MAMGGIGIDHTCLIPVLSLFWKHSKLGLDCLEYDVLLRVHLGITYLVEIKNFLLKMLKKKKI